MQPLSATTKSAPSVGRCVARVLDAVPPVMWFIRRQMRGQRGVLTVPQFRALLRVNREPPATLSAVAEHLSASLPTTSRIVSALVGKGLVTREMGTVDRRQVSLSITPQGRAVLRNARAGTQQRMELEMGSLTAEERRNLTDAMILLKRLFGPTARADDAGDAGISAPRRPKTGRPGRNGAQHAVRTRRTSVASSE